MQRTKFHRLGRYSVLHVNKRSLQYMSLKTKAVQEFQNTSSIEVGATFLSMFLSIFGSFWEVAEPSCKFQDSELQKS